MRLFIILTTMAVKGAEFRNPNPMNCLRGAALVAVAGAMLLATQVPEVGRIWREIFPDQRGSEHQSRGEFLIPPTLHSFHLIVDTIPDQQLKIALETFPLEEPRAWTEVIRNERPKEANLLILMSSLNPAVFNPWELPHQQMAELGYELEGEAQRIQLTNREQSLITYLDASNTVVKVGDSAILEREYGAMEKFLADYYGLSQTEIGELITLERNNGSTVLKMRFFGYPVSPAHIEETKALNTWMLESGVVHVDVCWRHTIMPDAYLLQQQGVNSALAEKLAQKAMLIDWEGSGMLGTNADTTQQVLMSKRMTEVLTFLERWLTIYSSEDSSMNSSKGIKQVSLRQLGMDDSVDERKFLETHPQFGPSRGKSRRWWDARAIIRNT